MKHLSRRERIMIGAAVCAVLWGCFYVLVYEPKEKEALRLKEEIRTVALEIDTIAQGGQDLENLEQEVAEAREKISWAKRNLSGRPQMEQLLRQLARDAARLDMDVILLQMEGEPDASQEESPYEKLSMVMDIQCPYPHLGVYLGGLREAAGLMSVDGFQIIRDEKIFPKLQVRLTLTTVASGSEGVLKIGD